MSEEMTREELTRYVVGYEGLYTVDIFGNIIRTQDKKIMSHQTNKQGYKCVSLSKDGVQKQYKVHRLIAEAFIPNPQNKPQINHIDGDKAHNTVWNLEWSTPKENTIHASDTGLVHHARKIMIVETGQRFKSMGSCARAINGSVGDISRCLRSDGRETHKGFHFKEIKDDE